ncbi:MAG TPA: HK97 family phage prohead protease [Candidatus Krumholzibacteria bacterium]|nr:HK97 family phage prohead protease [Candidatus Krumholzibacteria bacterium]HPD73523.1 HK97 family phage prohead protease [Candidatus Krumholzibacteria bacterium]HRY42245.1 HK97 family phage prohead protease [Candidatus Krumholzibacteria bacterium]
MDTRRKIFVGKTIEATKGKPIVAVASTDEPDLIGDVIYQGPNERGKGWLLDDYNKRDGRVYWMHDPFQPNLAKASARVDGNRLLLTVQFDMADPFAAELDRKYREGFLSEWSVGFRPRVYDEHNDSGGWTFYEQDLREVSAVNQGMHPGTAVISKAWTDYVGAAAEIKSTLDGFDSRLREIEAAIMRGETEKSERRIQAMLDEIRQIRTCA